MLGWLSRFISGWAGFVDRKYLDLVHWGLHAVAGVIDRAFGRLLRAWRVFWAALKWWQGQVWGIYHRIYVTFWWIFHRAIPGVYGWAQRRLAQLAGWTLAHFLWLLNWAQRQLRILTSWVKAQLNWLYHFIIREIDALWKRTWHYLVIWGYFAWWWLTHLDKLAEAMIRHIVAAAEKDAWWIAEHAGEFILALFVHNVRRVATLLETILDAVL